MTLINVFTPMCVHQTISFLASTLEGPVSVNALLLAVMSMFCTFINIHTIPMTSVISESLLALAQIRARSVHAERSVSEAKTCSSFMTLIDVNARFLVRRKSIASMASAKMRAKLVDT